MIYLIRHGKTEATERHLYCGSTDLPLSPLGVAELKELCYDVQARNFITSGMKRTEETLQIIFGDVPHSQNTAFREVDFGNFEMRSYEELKDNLDYVTWLNGDNDANIPPHGESGNQMKERVLAAFSEVQNHTVIITHGGVIAAIMGSLFPEEDKNRYEWQPKPGCGYFIHGCAYGVIPQEARRTCDEPLCTSQQQA